MWTPQFALAVLAFLVTICQASLLDSASLMPACSAIPQSACQTFTNDTCICNDVGLSNAIQECLLTKCTVIETLTVAKVQSQACNKPVRDRSSQYWGFIPLQVFSLICMMTRIYFRWRTKSFALDDWITTVIMILFIPFAIMGETGPFTGGGKDIWMDTPDQITLGLKFLYIAEILYAAILTLCKLNVLFFYLRIFPSRGIRIWIYITAGYVLVAGIIFFFLSIFQCWPVDVIWQGWTTGSTAAHCINLNIFIYAAASVSLSHEVIILVLPLRSLFKLQLNLQKKLGVVLMFSMGSLIIMISCFRMAYLNVFTTSTDITWDWVDVALWTSAEVNVSIIVICLPAVRLYLASVWPKAFASTNGPSQAYGNENKTFGSSVVRVYNKWQLKTLQLGTTFTPDTDPETGSQVELEDKRQGAQVEITAYTESRASHNSSNNSIEDNSGHSQDHIYSIETQKHSVP